VVALDYLLTTLAIVVPVTFCLLIIIYTTIRIFANYTDIGKNKKNKKDKDKKIQESTDDIPYFAIEAYDTPKIETSFGGQRIGEVHEHSSKD